MKNSFLRGKKGKFLHWIQQGALAICLGALLGGSFAESQAATLDIGRGRYTLQQNRQNHKWQWNSTAQLLDAATLSTHLNALRADCFRELGRLILAQGWRQRGRWMMTHNVGANNRPGYITQGVANDLPKVMEALSNHLFDHGHLGWYPQAVAYHQRDAFTVVDGAPYNHPRGIFNVDENIRKRIWTGILAWLQTPITMSAGIILDGAPAVTVLGYAIDPLQNPTLEDAAINLVAVLFSSNDFLNRPGYQDIRLEQGHCGNRNRFTITATYTGGTIEGIDYLTLGADNDCLGVKSSGKSTNEICVVVEVARGRIRIVSLFPFG